MSMDEILGRIDGNVAGMKETLANHGKSLEQLNDRVNALEQKTKGSRSVSLGIDDEERKKHPFSFQRAILAISEKNHKLAPFEMSVMKEAAAKRDLSTDVDTAGGYIVPTEYMADLIELLRAKLVVQQLGATRMSGLTGGMVQIPKQTGGATGYWVAEGASITSSQQTLGQIEMRPREAAGLTIMSNRLLKLSNPSAEAMVRNDLAATIDRLVDLAALQGVGGLQPLGIANTPDINTTAMGAAPTLDDLYDMILKLEEDNADDGALGWAFHPRTWNTLRQLKDSEGRYILTPGVIPSSVQDLRRGAQMGTLLGYPFRTTTQIPITLGAGADSRIFFGNWADLVIGEWGGIEILASQETSDAFAKNQTHVRIIVELDVVVRHAESFCVDSTVAA